MGSSKEQADKFYGDVMAGQNVEAKSVLGKVHQALTDVNDSRQIRVLLTDDEAFFLWENQRDVVIIDYIDTVTNGRMVMVAWYTPYNASLHIEDKSNLCEKCESLPGVT